MAKVISQPPRLLDITQAADYLGRNVYYVRRLVAHRGIRHYKIGHRLLFDPADLDAFLGTCLVEAQLSLRGWR
jgi:excisionase family DNA binding protein